MTGLPPIRELIPHAPPMLLLDELLERAPGRARCAVQLRPDSPFMENDRVRALISLEYMGQAAACAGLPAHSEGGAVAGGLLLGTRELNLAVEYFRAGDALVVDAERIFSDERVSSFRCRVQRDGALVAEATLSVLHEPGLEGAS